MSYKTNKENYILLAKIIYQYKDYMPRLAIQKMFTIDFIKNNYSKSTMISYLVNTRRYIKDGFIPKSFKGFPLMLKESLDRIIKGEAANIQLQEELLQPKEESKEMEVTEPVISKEDIYVKLNSLEENFKKNNEKLNVEIEQIRHTKELCERNLEILATMKEKIIYNYKAQKEALIEQHLRENYEGFDGADVI